MFCTLLRSCTSDVVTHGGRKAFPRGAADAQVSLGKANDHSQPGANPPLTLLSISVHCSWPRSESRGRNEGQHGLRASPAQLFSLGLYLPLEWQGAF